MTAPEEYHAGETVFSTRRTVNGQFLLAPDDKMTAIAGYATARGVRASRVDLHVSYWGANHNHNVFGDPRARRNHFYGTTNRLTTKMRNRHLSDLEGNPWGARRGTLWDGQRPGGIVLLDDQAILEKIIYTILNPVHDGLVDHPDQYPGFMIRPSDWGSVLTFERPGLYYRSAKGRDVVQIVPKVPAMFQEMDPHQAIELVRELVDLGASAVRKRRREEGRPGPIGADRLQQAAPWRLPAVPRPRPKRGRPKKKAREAPYANLDSERLEVERHGRRISLELRHHPEYPLFEDEQAPVPTPYQMRTVRSRKREKKKSFKERYPTEFPAQNNPPRYYSEDISKMKRRYGQYNAHVNRHERCMQKYRRGNRDVVFPAGTVRMRELGVKCARSP